MENNYKIGQKNKKYVSAVERYKKKRRREFLFLSSILIFLISIFLFINSSYVKIKHINVDGIYQLKQEDILNNISVNNDTKYWDVSENDVKNEILSKFNIIGDVIVEKKIFNTLNILVKEKKIVSLEKNAEDSYKPILEDGEIFEGIITHPFSVPYIENFENNTEQRNTVIKSILKLDELVAKSISEIVYIENEEAIVYMKDGQKVKININNFHLKLNYYLQIEKYIEDKNNTTLNLVNGVYLENNKTKEKIEKNIKNIIIDTENKKEENNKDKKN
ncbi:cell division protein FtsQ/DivIB [Gemelliphila palaticanis]|uniref:FtsQ-type POTRA domain-containing protein n=1 Tax=Gemelliphila palaticanis TaxID=81950 RepID=A0ABX2T0K6_9BACL|nr:FtsQ-type POTRA domain-containing protein [Gemella palaticanis]MBF0715029.1 FtsQ-type POTRA domain-containing protein [Gemella palaticanis]NYS46959.1 FtsQ-type POTRA domain-containing protein [Gemella palaticanis]